ncbi:hypothetical protein Aperf_G00000038143 [Anoplocephala perfoliata]
MNVRKIRSIARISLLAGFIIFALLLLREYGLSRDKCYPHCSSNKFNWSSLNDSTEYHLVGQKILHLINVSVISKDDLSIDAVYVEDQVRYISRVLEPPNMLVVPHQWCGDEEMRKNLTSSTFSEIIMECYKAIENTQDDYQMIVQSLRTIRDAFKLENVTIVMTYGSLIGSIRYHRRTPFDSDYDLVIRRSDQQRAERIFYKLAVNSDNRMRILDFIPVTGCIQIGLACPLNDSWRNPDFWKSFNNSLTFRDGIPVASNWDPYKDLIGVCGIYVDIYIFDDDDVHFQTFEEVSILHRPIEGTLFRTLSEPMTFLKSVYRSSVKMCIPKNNYFWHGEFRTLPEYCSAAIIPCAWLDGVYPRVYSFSIPEQDGNVEVGLERSPEGACLARSIFVSRYIA